MNWSARPLFLSAFLLLMLGVALAWYGRLPPGGLLGGNGEPFGRWPLISACMWLSIGWFILVLPWSLLLRHRLKARQRLIGLAFIPAVLSGLAVIIMAVGAAVFGTPVVPAQIVDQMALTNHDFILLDSILTTATAIASLALVLSISLSVEALRPDAKGIEQVFS